MRRFNSGRVVNSLRRIDTLFTAQAMSPSPLSCPDLDLAGRGWRMPAEWEPHERTWMGWPERTDNWMQNARPAQAAFAAVATAIRRFEPVTVCASAAQVQRARAALPPEVEVVELAQGDAWFRDSGPAFVTWDELEDRAGTGEDGGVASGREESLRGVRARRVGGVDWKFNAWGGLYSPCEEDDAVAAGILKLAGSSSGAPCQRWRAPLVMEGGSIHVDGEGTLLTTAECLLHRNRNPELSKALIEGWLAKLLNVQTFIWLPNGLEADEDTNGHVDNMACFAAPGLVLLSWTDDDKDPQYARSLAALRILEAARDAKGRALRVLKLPLPPPLAYAPEEVEPQMEQGRAAGKRLAASYANFYICNGGVVAPAFGCPEADERARRVLEEAFPNRTVVSVPSRSILLGGGNIHCITQQQPKAWGHVDA